MSVINGKHFFNHSVFCVSMGVETMDTFETTKQLNSVLRFVGLSCIYRDGTVLKQSSSLCRILFFIITLTFGNILSLYIKFYMNGGLTSFSFKDAIHFVYLLGYFLYVCDMFFVYKYRHTYLEYITMYDNIDRILGVNNNRLIKSKVTKISLLFVTIDLLSSLFEYFSWVYFYGWCLSTIYSIEFVYYIFKSLSLADMTASLIQFEYRLRVIGDLLENTGKNITLIKPIKQKLTDMPLDNEVYKIDMAAANHDRPETIKLITKCYLFILDQADSINTIYGFRILLTSVIILKTLVMLLNILIRLFLGSLYTDSQELKYFFIISTMIRVIIRNFVAISSTHRIEMSYRQNERIIKIIDRTLILKNVSPPTARALRGLRKLIMSRPLSFHAHNFFRLDYTFLVSIYSATVTYTIILLQNVQ